MEADALIVGAGPAGATAALNLAPFHRVVLIDRRKAPTPRIGESLPGAARRLLADMGLWEGFLVDGHAPCHLHRSLWGGGSELMEKDALRDPDGCGWHLDRARFEARLRATAITRGARLLAPARPAGLKRDSSGWRVALESSDGLVTVKARLLIAADGKGSRLVNRLGARRRTDSRLVCAWIADGKAGLPSGLTQIEAEEEGWWYAVPLPGGGGVLAFHTDADLPAAPGTRSAEDLLMRAKRLRLLGEFAVPERWTAPRAGFCAASGGYLEPAAGPGWIAAGDAAQSYDPLASQGLFNALYTGLAAAEAADRALSGDAAGLPGYAAELRKVRAAYGHHLVAWYGLERRWPQSPFWRRRHSVGAAGEISAADHLPITPYPYRAAASVY
jgi:flavin-dependent dehydrogenase